MDKFLLNCFFYTKCVGKILDNAHGIDIIIIVYMCVCISINPRSMGCGGNFCVMPDCGGFRPYPS